MRRSSRIPALLLRLTLLLLATSGSAASAGDVKTEADAAPAPSEGVKIEPGLWQVTRTSWFPLVEETKTITQMECLGANPFTPERMAANQKSCKIDKSYASEGAMSWKMVCKNPTGGVEGTGSFESAGDTAHGQMKTIMKVGDSSLESETRWDGMRLGDCDMERPSKPKPQMQPTPKKQAKPKKSAKERGKRDSEDASQKKESSSTAKAD